MSELNTDLVSRVLEQIDAHPESWKQDVWFGRKESCGTVACFAGWTALLTGWKQVYTESPNVTRGGRTEWVKDAAAQELGLTPMAASVLFDGLNTREDLDTIIDAVKNGQTTVALNREGGCGCGSCDTTDVVRTFSLD